MKPNKSLTPQKKTPDRYYTLLAAAYSVCEDLGEGDARVLQYLHYAYDCYREFHFDHSHGVKVVEIPMKPWKQIDFPEDMVDWVQIAFKNGDQLLVMGQDSNIPMTFDKVNGVPQENRPSGNVVAPDGGLIPFLVYDGNAYGTCQQYYGSLSQYNHVGYFNVDWTQRVINFKETATGFSKVYLKYITDGLNYDGCTVIHPYAFAAIKNGIHWKRKEYDDRYGAGDKERSRRLWNDSLHKFDMRMMHVTIEDVREATRSGFKLVVKN